MSTYSTGLVCLLVLTSTICMKIATGNTTSSTIDVSETTSQTVTTPNDTLTTSEISESTTTEPSNVTPNSETPSSTLTQKSSQTSPNTVTTSGTSPTASPSSSTTANSTVSTVSMSTENTTSENTTVNSITTQTPNETTAAGSSGAVLTTTTTLTPTTSAAVTSTPAPIGLNPGGLFNLTFTVKDNGTVSCRNNCNYTSIQQDVVKSFINLEGFYAVKEHKESSTRRNTEFSVEVLFESKTMNGMEVEQIKSQTIQGFIQLNNTDSLIVDLANVENITENFATQCKNICRASNPCEDGYTCSGNACTSNNKCADKTCGRGSCLLNMETLVPYCVCESNNDYEYSGDKCENEEISKAKVIQIVSGVLGAFCALFLLIIIIMCCRRGSSKSSHLYQIGSPGYANDGYSNESELKRM